MDTSPIQQIKDKLDIVDIVGSYLKLQKTGINYRAVCPFHAEKKPSFFVSPTRQSCRCFGCNTGGDIFEFVQKIEGIEFGDALRLLAKRAGVELRTFRPELRTQRQRLYEICEISSKFFEKQLQQSSQGKLVKEYLFKRGLTEESIRKWRLGFAPAPPTGGWRVLSDFLVSRGYKREEVVSSGLAVVSEKAKTPYDRFRNRIIFPVFDLHSQVIGFGARIIEGQQEETAKYINIPNTLLYDKGKVLYGLNFGKVDIRKNDSCILTEGYMDVILSHQAGIINTVASSGTALTPFQLKILKRYTSNLLTAFDMDTAGDSATKRGIDLALEQDFEVKVICMPQDTDPADIITDSPKKWQEAVSQAKNIMNFYFDNACASFDKESPQGKKQIAHAILPAIKQLPNKILQFHWVQKLASALKVSEEAVLGELQKITKRKAPQASYASDKNKSDPLNTPKEKCRQELLEERILASVIQSPASIDLIDYDTLSYYVSGVGETLKILKKEKANDASKMQAVFVSLKQKGEPFKILIDNCTFKAEVEPCDNPEQEVEICRASITKICNKNKLQQISKEIQTAEQNKDEKKLKILMEQFNNLAAYAKS